jgi:hypothetical protein
MLRFLASLIIAIIIFAYCICTQLLVSFAMDITWWLGWIVYILSLSLAIYFTTRRL